MSPSISSRLLGLTGILGGAVLLAAFLVDIPPDFAVLRLVLFNLGAMAIVIGVHRRQASASRGLALAAAVPALLATLGTSPRSSFRSVPCIRSPVTTDWSSSRPGRRYG